MSRSNDNGDTSDFKLGCGLDPGASVTTPISLNISTTTGGHFTVAIDMQNSVDSLKKVISKKIKVAKDKICLLHRERELHDGTMKENGLMEGSKIILIPNVETGLLTQRPENTVMQALESLNDSQVNDFLSGKTPLNLSMRIGDHMMLIQLQLSTVNPESPPRSKSRSRSSQRGSSNVSTSNSIFQSNVKAQSETLNIKSNKDMSDCNSGDIKKSIILGLSNENHEDKISYTTKSLQSENDIKNSFLLNQEFENLKNIVKNCSLIQQKRFHLHSIEKSTKSIQSTSLSKINSDFSSDTLLDQSPIKSLSNLVSSPIKTATIKDIPIENNCSANSVRSLSTFYNYEDPISAKLTSCLCKRIDNSNIAINTNCPVKNCETNDPENLSNCSNSTNYIPFSSTLEKATEKTIGPIKKRYHHHHGVNFLNRNSKIVEHNVVNKTTEIKTATILKPNIQVSPSSFEDCTVNTSDSHALKEASRNLTQTLRKLSKEVFSAKSDSTEESSRKNGSGAVIESMKNHGKGIYSGTFSGTLNPALQDRYGRPKRDISTVIHILNDLLSATPQYNQNTKISFESPSTTSFNSTSKKQYITDDKTKESCTKCLINEKIGDCSYGECNGHYNTSQISDIKSIKHNLIKLPSLCSEKSKDCTASTSKSFNLICKSDFDSSSVDARNNKIVEKECDCLIQVSPKTQSIEQNLSYDIKKNMCNKCTTEVENSKTKCKLDQLRLVMQQRKQRREERKLKNAPYGACVVSTTSSVNGSNNKHSPSPATIGQLASSDSGNSNHIVEEVDTAA